MLAKGCVRYLANIVDMTQKREVVMSDIAIICTFPDVFLKNLLGLLPDWEIDFEIELLPGTTLISKVIYRWPQQSLRS